MKPDILRIFATIGVSTRPVHTISHRGEKTDNYLNKQQRII